jgi:hypothetical protein
LFHNFLGLKSFLNRFKVQHNIKFEPNREKGKRKKKGAGRIWPGRARSGLDPAQLASLPVWAERRTGTLPRPFDQAAIDGRGGRRPRRLAHAREELAPS